MKLRLGAAAREELRAALRWYLDEADTDTARRFEREVDTALRLIELNPRIGRPGPHGTRAWRLRKFPYALIYRVHDERLTVVAVAHQRRHPGYWQASS